MIFNTILSGFFHCLLLQDSSDVSFHSLTFDTQIYQSFPLRIGEALGEFLTTPNDKQKSMTIADHCKNANIQPYNKYILSVCCPGTIFCASIPNEQDRLPILRDLGVHRGSQTRAQFPMCCDNSFDKMHPNVMEEPRRGISIWKLKRTFQKCLANRLQKWEQHI